MNTWIQELDNIKTHNGMTFGRRHLRLAHHYLIDYALLPRKTRCIKALYHIVLSSIYHIFYKE